MIKYIAPLAMLLMVSCEKDAGTGGKASITGSVTLREYSDPAFNLILDERPAFGHNVFIIYGDDVSAGDNTDAGRDGRFEFKYLRKGSYKLYVISDDSAGASPFYIPDTVFIKQVEIKDKKETVEAGNFLVYKINN